MRVLQCAGGTEYIHQYFNTYYVHACASTASPSHADVRVLEVRIGDILILGSDGLFDNLFTEDILGVERRLRKDSKDGSVAVADLVC